MSRRRTAAALLVLFAAVLLLGALPAAACPVCYGEAEGPVIEGTKWSVAFLGGLVYLVLGGGVGMVVMQRRRVLRDLDGEQAGEDPHRGPRPVPEAERRAAAEPDAD